MIDILSILKDNKPRGTKLYSPVCGECELKSVGDKYVYTINAKHTTCVFDNYGKIYDDGECLLFPSKEMRDWDKFSWKKGDVLVNSNENHVIFSHWLDHTYTSFAGKYFMKPYSDKIATLYTKHWTKENSPSVAKRYIYDLEETNNGKLNLETLEIETSKKQEESTKEERKQENKEHEFKPFERVLVRDDEFHKWIPDMFVKFLHNAAYPYNCFQNNWKHCIPYEGNEKLYDTTNSPVE